MGPHRFFPAQQPIHFTGPVADARLKRVQPSNIYVLPTNRPIRNDECHQFEKWPSMLCPKETVVSRCWSLKLRNFDNLAVPNRSDMQGVLEGNGDSLSTH